MRAGLVQGKSPSSSHFSANQGVRDRSHEGGGPAVRLIISFVMLRTVSSNDLFPATCSSSRRSAIAFSRDTCRRRTLAHFCTVSRDATMMVPPGSSAAVSGRAALYPAKGVPRGSPVPPFGVDPRGPPPSLPSPVVPSGSRPALGRPEAGSEGGQPLLYLSGPRNTPPGFLRPARASGARAGESPRPNFPLAKPVSD